MAWIKKIPAWAWANLGNIAQIATWGAAFALPAWAANSMTMMQQYAPGSWVIAGFCGLIALSVVYALTGWGKGVWVNAKIKERFTRQTDRFNPLDTIFQKQRIAIADLCNPMEQIVRNKKFLDCEMIGPANILLLYTAPGTGKIIGCGFNKTDAVSIADHVIPQTAIAFVDCDFERCQFYNVVMLSRERDVQATNVQIAHLHWVTPREAAPPSAATTLALSSSSAPKRKRWPFGNS